MALWTGIVTKEQAERMVKENLLDAKSFCVPFAVRTLSKYEKMYAIKKSGNPSCWLGFPKLEFITPQYGRVD